MLEFGDDYNPTVSMALTWKEFFELFADDAETETLDISGLHVLAQIRDTATPGPTDDPILEFCTAGFRDTPPDWPSIDGAFTVTDAVNGKIAMSVLRDDYAATVSVDNSKVKLFWQVILINKDTDETAPIVEGAPTFMPARAWK